MQSRNAAAEYLGSLLKKRRVALRRDQQEVAFAAGISVPYLSNLERGYRDNLAPEKLIRLAEVLGLPVRRVVRAAMDARTADLQAVLDAYEERNQKVAS